MRLHYWSFIFIVKGGTIGRHNLNSPFGTAVLCFSHKQPSSGSTKEFWEISLGIKINKEDNYILDIQRCQVAARCRFDPHSSFETRILTSRLAKPAEKLPSE